MSVNFTVSANQVCYSGLSTGKSPGHDRLSIEHLKFTRVHLGPVLGTFFSLCLNHTYLYAELTQTIIVPIIKNKTGDISQKSNYRPISLAAVIVKMLDSDQGP